MEFDKSYEMISNSDIGRSLKKRRLENKLKQAYIAEGVLDIHRQSYAKIENGEVELTMIKAIKLCNYYHVSIDELVGYEMKEGKKEKLKAGMVKEGMAEYKKSTPLKLTISIEGAGENSESANHLIDRLGKLLEDTTRSTNAPPNNKNE